MILRFSNAATLDQRAHVDARLRELDVRAVPADGALLLRDALSLDEIHDLACMPGVAGVTTGKRTYATLRVAAMGWLSAACAVLGALTLLAANIPASLGTPADPLRTPETLRSSWPLLPIHGLVERAPDWLPVSLLPALALTVIVAWPLIARGLAESRPRVHTAIGAVAIVIVAWLTFLEIA